jgi:hypothetical protein
MEGWFKTEKKPPVQEKSVYTEDMIFGAQLFAANARIIASLG